ncbi:MAG: hypothetical protein WKG07_08835 [Hymenobacter sp.]
MKGSPDGHSNCTQEPTAPRNKEERIDEWTTRGLRRPAIRDRRDRAAGQRGNPGRSDR